MNIFYQVILNSIKKIDYGFLFCIFALQILGLITLYSASYDASGIQLHFFKQQIFWIFLGWLVFLIIYYSKREVLCKLVWPFFLLHIVCLVLIFFIGKQAYNTTRWLDLGLFYFQPSETLKFSLSLLISTQLAQSKLSTPINYKYLVKLFLFLLPPLFLIFVQPDLGTAGMILLILVFLILFKGLEKKLFFVMLAMFLFSAPLAWIYLLKPYQKSRVTSFINPDQDPRGQGYNVIQSKIAIGSGQIFGKGFKKGTQNNLKFLPERHTDFIFSVLSEEYGFLGSSLTLILFFILICLIFNLASQTRDRLSCYFCISSAAFFLWHVTLNMAMTMGLFPVVGIPLPLFSYGGSHTITSMAFLGLTASVYKNKDLF